MLYVVVFICSFIFTYFIKNYAIKKSLLAEVTERSSHKSPIPHGGGIAIVITWLLGITYLFVNNEIESNLYIALMIGIIISIVSYVDDLFDLTPKLRLLFQSCVAIGGLVSLGGFNSLNVGLFSIDNQFITNSFAFFMIIWFINIYNFLDGIDGYAGTEVIFLSIAGLILFGGNHFLVLAVAAFGFLIWNWHQAKIFMGDVGSTLLGYTVAVFTIYYGNIKSENFWIWIILFGIFWFDATLTLYRRKKNGEKISQAHRKHAYQRLTQIGWSHSKVVIYSIYINLLLFCIVYFISNIFIAFILAIILLYATMYFVDYKKAFK